ncbi:type IV secretion system protein [Patescibacteria group bacterium]|nr:type IV secretion system protein [Patescibacteria group bacterium]
MNKHKKIVCSLILILLISSLGIFVLGAKNVQAAVDLGIVDGLKTVLGEILIMIQELIGKIIVWFVGLATGLLHYKSLQNSSIVELGWKTLRDLVNMFFVLALLVIAFATILRVETYGMKSLLPKLIGVALLINFSLVLAGAVIDFSGVLTNFFLENESNFFINIADSMGLPKIMVSSTQDGTTDKYKCIEGMEITSYVKDCSACSIGATCAELPINKTDWSKIQGDIYWKVILALFLSIIFTTIAAFVFGALAFLLLIRLIIIWFLLILVPLACFFWILPATKSMADKWLDNFIKWVFFAPAVTFFIWLSVKSWTKFITGQASLPGGEIIPGVQTVVTDELVQNAVLPRIMDTTNLIPFILTCGMLIGSLIVAQKLGIYGAQGAIDLGKSISKGTGKWVGGRAQQWSAPAVGKMGEAIQKSWVGKAPILKHAVRPFRGFQEQERATLDEAEKRYKNYTSDNLKSQFGASDPRHKAAIAKILAGRGDFEKNDELGFTDKSIEESLTLTKRYGKEKDILKARPDLAGSPDSEEGKAAIKKIIIGMKPKDAERLQIEAVNKPKVLKIIVEQFKEGGSLNKDFLVKASDTNPAVYAKLKKEIEKDLKNMSSDVQKYFEGTPGKAVTGDYKPIIIIPSSGGESGQKISDEDRAKARKDAGLE